MVRSKTDQDAGPVIELFFTNGGYDHGYLEGFLETIGYKAFGKLNIQTIDNIDEILTRGHVVTFEPNYNHPDSANDEVLFKEGFTLNGIIKYDSDFYLQQFEVNAAYKQSFSVRGKIIFTLGSLISFPPAYCFSKNFPTSPLLLGPPPCLLSFLLCESNS